MKKEYIIFGILGLIALYALSRLRAPEVQQVAEFIPTGQADAGSGLQEAREAGRLGAFGNVAEVAAIESQAKLGRYQTDAQLEATNIAARVQEALGLGEIASREAQLRETLGYNRFAADLAGDIQRKGIDAMLEGERLKLGSEERMFRSDLESREAQSRLQIDAVNAAAREYRNQSLERQGTILNALTTTYGRGNTYNYQDAFGGPRKSWLDSVLNFGASILQPIIRS